MTKYYERRYKFVGNYIGNLNNQMIPYLMSPSLYLNIKSQYADYMLNLFLKYAHTLILKI